MAAPAFQAAGAVVKSAAGVTPAWPTHIADDVALLFVETANQAATLTTANGFVEVTNSPQGTGTAAATTATRLTVFWCRATSAAMAAPVVADSGDHQIAVIVTFRGCIATGNPWDVTAGSVAAVATTAFSIPTVTTTVDECLLVLAITNNGQSDTTQVTNTPTNSALTSITKRLDSQPVLPNLTSTMLRVGPYAGMTSEVGIGPGGDTGAPYYRIAGINPHSDFATLEAQIAIADDLDITLFATTPDTPSDFGASTAAGFDLVRYKAKIDTLAALPYFVAAVQRQRVVCLIGDEPQHSKWNNSSGVSTWTPTLVNDCARYHKTKFGSNAITVIRVDCHRLKTGWGGNAAPTYDGLDYGIMQYEGPNAQADQTFRQAYDADVAEGALVNLGCIPSLNLWAGGNHRTVGGVAACWDYLATGTSSGVVAGTIQGGTSPYTAGQNIECATWNATPTAGKRTLVSSPAWIRAAIDACYNDATIPWFVVWTYANSALSNAPWMLPLQTRSDVVAAHDYAINKGLSRSAFNGLRTIKAYP